MTTSVEDTIYLMRLCEEDSFAYMFPSLSKMEEIADCYLFHLFLNVPGSSVCMLLRKGQATKETKLGKETCFPYSWFPKTPSDSICTKNFVTVDALSLSGVISW